MEQTAQDQMLRRAAGVDSDGTGMIKDQIDRWAGVSPRGPSAVGPLSGHVCEVANPQMSLMGTNKTWRNQLSQERRRAQCVSVCVHGCVCGL